MTTLQGVEMASFVASLDREQASQPYFQRRTFDASHTWNRWKYQSLWLALILMLLTFVMHLTMLNYKLMLPVNLESLLNSSINMGISIIRPLTSLSFCTTRDDTHWGQRRRSVLVGCQTRQGTEGFMCRATTPQSQLLQLPRIHWMPYMRRSHNSKSYWQRCFWSNLIWLEIYWKIVMFSCEVWMTALVKFVVWVLSWVDFAVVFSTCF